MSSNKRKSTNPDENTAKKGFWNLGLVAEMKDPSNQVYKDERIVIIKDKYPKAQYHFLVLPWASIPNLKSLRTEHIDLLRYMEEKAKEIAEAQNTKESFRFGYHAVPSMSHVHLHVISQDFNSPCLKTKKHWNSFTTKYFINSEDVIKQLEENGSVSEITEEERKQILNKPLRCHICKKEQPNMPKLKQHIVNHSR